MRWIPLVFVRVFLFFSAGILTGIYFPDSIDVPFARYCLLTLVVLYTIVAILNQQKKLKFNIGFIALTALFLAGYSNILAHTDSRLPEHFINQGQPIDYYTVVVEKSPEEKAKSWKIEANLQQIHVNNEWVPGTAKLLLYFTKNDFLKPFQYGDVLLIKGTPQRVQPPANPEEFNFQKYLSYKNIYHQQFIRGGEVTYLGYDPQNAILKYAFIARSWAEKTLKNYIHGNREQSIASALVLGVTDGLDGDLLSAYASTGTLHVLSVSGLHVSIIYLILVFMLKPLNRYTWGVWTLAIVSFVVLWGYAFLTGLSPSVLRAVTMFSFVALAKPWGRRTNIYNTLAISAFFLLLYDPHLIMSVGFQLSYLAVLGIVYLQPKLYITWEPKSRIWDELWKVTSVSIAAQLATFSLGLLYFHQFPNYFLFSNLLVIPESFGVLVVGLGLLVFAFIHPFASILGLILEWIIKIMNFTVFSIESLPYSLINNIYISPVQCLLLIALMVAIILMVQRKKIIYLYYAVCFSLLFSALQWQHFYKDVNVNKIVMYHVPGHCAIDLMGDGSCYFMVDSSRGNNLQTIHFHITPNRIKSCITTIHKIDDYRYARNFPGGKLILWKDKSILCLSDKKYILPEHIQVDYCVLSHNSVSSLTAIISHIKFQKLIIDSSNSYAVADKLLEQSKQLNLQVYSILHHYAFTETLKNI